MGGRRCRNLAILLGRADIPFEDPAVRAASLDRAQRIHAESVRKRPRTRAGRLRLSAQLLGFRFRLYCLLCGAWRFCRCGGCRIGCCGRVRSGLGSKRRDIFSGRPDHTHVSQAGHIVPFFVETREQRTGDRCRFVEDRFVGLRISPSATGSPTFLCHFPMIQLSTDCPCRGITTGFAIGVPPFSAVSWCGRAPCI